MADVLPTTTTMSCLDDFIGVDFNDDDSLAPSMAFDDLSVIKKDSMSHDYLMDEVANPVKEQNQNVLDVTASDSTTAASSTTSGLSSPSSASSGSRSGSRNGGRRPADPASPPRKIISASGGGASSPSSKTVSTIGSATTSGLTSPSSGGSRSAVGDLADSDDAELAMQRKWENEGKCGNCGTKTHHYMNVKTPTGKSTLLGKKKTKMVLTKVPLTLKGVCHEGRCLNCHPKNPKNRVEVVSTPVLVLDQSDEDISVDNIMVTTESSAAGGGDGSCVKSMAHVSHVSAMGDISILKLIESVPLSIEAPVDEKKTKGMSRGGDGDDGIERGPIKADESPSSPAPVDTSLASKDSILAAQSLASANAPSICGETTGEASFASTIKSSASLERAAGTAPSPLANIADVVAPPHHHVRSKSANPTYRGGDMPSISEQHAAPAMALSPTRATLHRRHLSEPARDNEAILAALAEKTYDEIDNGSLDETTDDDTTLDYNPDRPPIRKLAFDANAASSPPRSVMTPSSRGSSSKSSGSGSSNPATSPRSRAPPSLPPIDEKSIPEADNIITSLSVSRSDKMAHRHLVKLRTLSIQYQKRVAIGRAGGVPVIINALKRFGENTAAVAKQCCAVLQNLSSVEGNATAIVLHGGVEAVVKAMETHYRDAGVQEMACAALRNVASHPCAENRCAIGKAGGVRTIIGAMRRHNSSAKICDKGVAALGNVCLKSDSNRREVGKEGGVAAILHAMREHDGHEGVSEKGMKVLWDLTRNPLCVELLGCEDGVEDFLLGVGARFPRRCKQKALQIFLKL